MTGPWTLALIVGGGGFAGSVARYGLSVAAQRCEISWPAGTLGANVLGCLALGILTGFADRGEALTPEVRLALATGFCGGFTTMSTMVYESAAMARAGEYLHATLYTAGTFLLSMTAFAAGVVAVRVCVKYGGGLWN